MLYSVRVANIEAGNQGNFYYLKPSEPPTFEEFTKLDGNYKIDWDKEEISGTITLRGEWNILLVSGLYFFLEEIKPLGSGVFVYKVIRWVWVNDVLNAKGTGLRVTGILSKTNRESVVLNNVLKTIPTIENGNRIIFSGVDIQKDEDEEEPDELFKAPSEKFYKGVTKGGAGVEGAFYQYWHNPKEETPQMQEVEGQEDNPLPEFTFLYQTTPVFTWQGKLIHELRQYVEDEARSFKVWDFNTSHSGLYKKLAEAYPSNKNKVYTIADDLHTGARRFSHSKSETKGIKCIDLSGLSGIKKLDDATLQELQLKTVKAKEIYTEDDSGFNNVIKGIRLELKTEKKQYERDGQDVELPQDLGTLEHGPDEATPIFIKKGITPRVIVGYKFEGDKPTEPIYANVGDLAEGSAIINLNRYRVKHGTDEYTEETALKTYQGYISGEAQELSGDDFISLGITALKLNGKPTQYIASFKRMELDGVTTGGKNYISLLIFEPQKRETTSEKIQILPESGPLVEDYSYWYYWSTMIHSPYRYDSNYTSELTLQRDSLWTGYGWATSPRPEYSNYEPRKEYQSGYFSKKKIWQTFRNLAYYIKTPHINKLIEGIYWELPRDLGPDKIKHIDISGRPWPLPPGGRDDGGPALGDPYASNPVRKFLSVDVAQYSYSSIPLQKYRVRCLDSSNLYLKGYLPYEGANTLETWGGHQEHQHNLKLWFRNWNKTTEEGDFYIYPKTRNLTLSDGDRRQTIIIFKKYKEELYRLIYVLRGGEDLTAWNPGTYYFRGNKRGDYGGWSTTYKNALSFNVGDDNDLGNFIYSLVYLAHVDELPSFSHSGRDCVWLGEHRARGNWIYTHSELYDRPTGRSADYVSYVQHLKTLEIVYYTGRLVIPPHSKQLIDLGTLGPEDDIPWYSDDEAGEFYDLEGTNFYLFRKVTDSRPYYEFIIKNNDTTLVNRTEALNRRVTITQNITDPIQVVNSFNNLHVFGQLIPLKWRGKISGSTKFKNFQLRNLDLEGSNSAVDAWLLSVETEVDAIRTVIQVVKKKSAIQELESISKYEEIRYRTRQEMQLTQNNLSQFYNSKNRFHMGLMNQAENIQDAESWRNMSRWSSGIALGTQVLSGLINPIGLLGLGGSITGAIGQDLQQGQNIRRQKRDYELNKRFGSEEFRLRTEATQINFELANMASVRNLINLQSNVSISSGSGDPTLFRSIQALEQTAPVYLQTTVPDGYIYDELKKHYDDYGYDINLSGYEIRTQEMKKNDVWKFDKVKQISGVTSPIITNIIREIFENGFKIV